MATNRENDLRRSVQFILFAMFVAVVNGCGSSNNPELGSVYGRVTLDGESLAEASVRFQPTEGGRPAFATTDEDGNYELQYTKSSSGALLGKHVVRIYTGEPGYDDGEYHPPVPERVPVQYNRDALDNPDMNVDITSGSNQFDFTLASEGEVEQPDDIQTP